MAGVAFRVGRTAGRLCQRGLGDADFVAVGKPGQNLDGAAVAVARGEIHRGKAARSAQPRIDKTDLFEKLGPFRLGDLAHAGDDIAHRHIRGRLPLLCACQDGFDRGALPSQPVFQPTAQRRFCRVEAAQPLGNLRGHDFRQFGAFGILHRKMQGLGGSAVCPQRAVHQQISGQPQALPFDDLFGQPPHVLDQNDAQRDRNRPKLADPQRLDILIGSDEPGQHRAGHQAVGMGDIGPGKTEDAGVAGERTFGEFRQLPIIARWQIAGDLLKLVLDKVIVVQQPFRRRCHRLSGVKGCRRFAVGGQQHLCIVLQSDGQPKDPGRAPKGNGLRRRQRPGVMLQPLGTEQICADRRLVLPEVPVLPLRPDRGRIVPQVFHPQSARDALETGRPAPGRGSPVRLPFGTAAGDRTGAISSGRVPSCSAWGDQSH